MGIDYYIEKSEKASFKIFCTKLFAQKGNSHIIQSKLSNQ